MSEQSDIQAVPEDVLQQAKSLVGEEDFVLLWQEQMLSIRSELKAVIDTQKTFQAGLEGLETKLPELVGDLPIDLLPKIEESIRSAEEATERVRRHEQTLATLRTEIKAWADRLQQQPMVYDQQVIDAVPALADQVRKLPELQSTFPDFMQTMKEADSSAAEMQKEILNKVAEVCRSVTARLEFEGEGGSGSTHKGYKELAEKAVENVGWFLSKISFGLISEEHLTMVKAGVQTLANAIKEAHVQVNIAWADETGINELLDKMGPFAIYRTNLMKLKDGVGAGLDLAGLTGLIPGVGEALNKGVGLVKTVLTKQIDGQLEQTAKLEEEMTQAYEELKAKGEPTPDEVKLLKERSLSIGGRLDTLWGALKDEVHGVQDSWENESRNAFREMWDKGSEAGNNYLYDKAVETISGTIARLLAQLLPQQRPDAVFNFEISGILNSLVVEKSTDFTQEEKDELAKLSA